MRRCLLIALLLMPAAAGIAQGGELAAREARLETLREAIGELQAEIERDRERAGGLAAELGRLEQRLGEERGALRRLEAAITARQQRIDDLDAAIARRAARIEAQREQLAAGLRATYREGRVAGLRLILNAEDPARLQRLLVYRERIAAARGDRVREAESAIRALQEQRAERQAALEAQRDDRRERESRLADLAAARAERDALLESIRERIRERDERLATRREEAESLNRLIDDLRERLAATEPAPGEAAAMAAGELAWPHEGPLLARYGSERAAGLEWTGLLIGGDTGAPIQPVAPGQVVFADWLRGLGLLLIIDHGQGYLSLYGRNEALYVEVGDRVTSGDVIATVGRSGGRAETALYFELRADGEPVDPLTWLRARDNQG